MRSPQGGDISEALQPGRSQPLNLAGLKQIGVAGVPTTWRPDAAGRFRRRRLIIRVHRRHPYAVLVDAVTLLNQDLSPTARLAYAVLAADQLVDVGSATFDLEHIARTVGLADSDALLPVLAELTAVGVVDEREHHGLGLALSVNLEAIPPANQQPCVPCDDCGQCSCGGLRGVCQPCSEARASRVPEAERANEMDSRWVYAVSTEADPTSIKIGVAANIQKRLKQLQLGSASPIVLRWQSPGGFPLESHLHEKFTRLRIAGEWFNFQRTADPVKAINKATQTFLQQYESIH
ncbi:GIY-YIG nuclease family protein [Streptomyces sp. PTY087I2]|uniref:GIY-YIG nuclease family protein n=1 Tax=Streptomyces sp. PTY087I2 TaxID=1819298 RepID=UPI00159ED663|nr:GIY-YIG nuclease family protein [Streptomyces sp. PTY087I2]